MKTLALLCLVTPTLPAHAQLEAGLSRGEIDVMTKCNPARLLGL